nr:trafficking kinesin-binding protein 1-like [Oncorhynchus nerka]
MSTLAEELARKTDDGSRQQEEITHLLSQIVDLQKKSKSYAVENQELTQHLGAAKDAQRQLTAELRELEDKYAECMEMLHEAQEELKNLRNKSLPLSTPRRFHSLGLFPMVSDVNSIVYAEGVSGELVYCISDCLMCCHSPPVRSREVTLMPWPQALATS